VDTDVSFGKGQLLNNPHSSPIWPAHQVCYCRPASIAVSNRAWKPFPKSVIRNPRSLVTFPVQLFDESNGISAIIRRRAKPGKYFLCCRIDLSHQFDLLNALSVIALADADPFDTKGATSKSWPRQILGPAIIDID